MTNSVRGVILDIDGTLVDSNDLHARAWVETLAEFGYTVEYERVRRLIGMGGDKMLPETTGVSPDSDEGEKISKRRGELFKAKFLAEVRPFPETREMLARMREGGI